SLRTARAWRALSLRSRWAAARAWASSARRRARSRASSRSEMRADASWFSEVAGTVADVVCVGVLGGGFGVAPQARSVAASANTEARTGRARRWLDGRSMGPLPFQSRAGRAVAARRGSTVANVRL